MTLTQKWILFILTGSVLAYGIGAMMRDSISVLTWKSSPVPVVATEDHMVTKEFRPIPNQYLFEEEMERVKKDHVGGEEKMVSTNGYLKIGSPTDFVFGASEVFIRAQPNQKIFIISNVTSTNLVWPKL